MAAEGGVCSDAERAVVESPSEDHSQHARELLVRTKDKESAGSAPKAPDRAAVIAARRARLQRLRQQRLLCQPPAGHADATESQDKSVRRRGGRRKKRPRRDMASVAGPAGTAAAAAGAGGTSLTARAVNAGRTLHELYKLGGIDAQAAGRVRTRMESGYESRVPRAEVRGRVGVYRCNGCTARQHC